MYRSLVQRQQLVTGISAGVDERRGPSALYISALVLPGKQPADVEAAIDVELERLKSEPVADWEMQKIKNSTRASYLGAIRSAQSRASQLSTYKVYYDDPNLINTRLTRLSAVTKDDVQRVAKTYLKRERRVVMYVTPGPAASVPKPAEAR